MGVVRANLDSSARPITVIGRPEPNAPASLIRPIWAYSPPAAAAKCRSRARYSKSLFHHGLTPRQSRCATVGIRMQPESSKPSHCSSRQASTTTTGAAGSTQKPINTSIIGKLALSLPPEQSATFHVVLATDQDTDQRPMTPDVAFASIS